MVDTATRRALVAPASAAAAAVAAGVVLYVRDPHTSHYLPCPFHAVTGLWCPGCGGTRAAGDLVRGDVASAMSSNVLAVVVLAGGLVVWGLWVRARYSARPMPRPRRWMVAAGVAVMVAFTVLRNVDIGAVLAP